MATVTTSSKSENLMSWTRTGGSFRRSFRKGSLVNRFFILMLVLLLLAGCSPAARSKKSWDEIRTLVAGKTEAEVTKLLGNPDHREKLPFGDERWTWWNYTYLGKEWAPEVRGKIVHLEITFAGP